MNGMARKRIFIIVLMVSGFVAGCVSMPEINEINYEAGKKLYQQGNYEGAIKHFKASADERSYCRDFELLGNAYYANGNYREALDTYRRAMDRCNIHAYSVMNGMLKSARVLGECDNAIPLIEQLISKEPANPTFFVLLSFAYNCSGQYDQALTAAKRAVELNPQYSSAYQWLGYAYSKKKQYNKAIAALKRAVAINPKDYYCFWEMGYCLSKNGDYREAAKAYRKAAQLNPDDMNYWTDLSLAYFRMGGYDDALKAIENALISGVGIEIKMEDYALVVKVFKEGPAGAAGIEAADKITRIDGVSTKGLDLKTFVKNCRGPAGSQVVLKINRNGKRFEKRLTRALIPTEKSGEALGIRSLVYRKQGRLEDAWKDAEKAFEFAPADENAQIAMAAAHLDRGNYDEAIKLLSAIKDITPARIFEATAHAKKGNAKKAIAIYLDIPDKDLSPGNVPLRNDHKDLLLALKPVALVYEENARQFEVQGRFQEALAEYAGALALATDDNEEEMLRNSMFQMVRRMPRPCQLPENAHRHAVRGETLVKEGSYKEASSEFNKAIKLAPFSARLYFNSALVCVKFEDLPKRSAT
jgi:superkiller protein 3